MKTICTYLFLMLGFGQLFSQELLDFNKVRDDLITINNLYAINEETETTTDFMVIGSDAFTIQLFNYGNEDISFGFSTRLEEELPYEETRYDYVGFYYLDFNVNYDIGDFNFGLSLENILNFDSKDFSIDPNLEITNGTPSAFYLSHEADALISFSIAYNF